MDLMTAMYTLLWERSFVNQTHTQTHTLINNVLEMLFTCANVLNRKKAICYESILCLLFCMFSAAVFAE